MSAVGRVLCREFRRSFNVFKTFAAKESRSLSTVTPAPKDDASGTESLKSRKELVEDLKSQHQPADLVPPEYRFLYPEFLPDPAPGFRNPLRERLERMDMMARRAVIDIPEFYVGSILAVTFSEPHAPGKANRFVGICIDRRGCGLRASFILRNVIDNQGVECVFEMYDPNIQKVDCLRLEKRLDEKLFYLRDALPKYSTFPVDMEMELLPEGAPVPVNDIQVEMKPLPWLEKWERQDLKGIKGLYAMISQKRRRASIKSQKPWEKYDLMKIYRETIPEEEQKQIFAQVYTDLHNLEITRRKMKRKRGFVRPSKAA